LEVVFWSPARGGQTTRNMKILANIYRIRYGMQVRTFENYEAYGKYHFMENMQKQNRQKKKGHVFVDCKNDRNRQVWRLLQRADTVVINFPQEYPVLLNYFQNHPRISGNIFYLISNSPSDPMDNEKIYRRVFRLEPEETGVIPYDVRFEHYYAKNQGFACQKSVIKGEPCGVGEEFAAKTFEIAVKLLKMNCVFEGDTLYYC